MGYYVRIVFSNFTIPSENVDEAYRRLISLNDNDDLKRGGSWGGEYDARSPRPEGFDHHPGKWFSWMHADYPAKCNSLQHIFRQLGFDVDVDDNGDVHLTGYDNKTGQEDIFLDEIIDLTTGEIHWIGEDDTLWKTISGVKENAAAKMLDFQAKVEEMRS